MSKIYSINNEEVPSIEYISEIVKMISDEIKTLNTNFNGFPSIKTNTEQIKIDTIEKQDINASSIKTDPRHRFINEALLTTFVNKPSNFEIEQSLDAVKQELREEIEKSYMRIINTPNAIIKLRDIYTILNNENAINGLLDTLSYKVTMEDFKEHKDSYVHLNNNDRKALNILLKCVTNNFADWNAKDDEVNAIKNKPTSLPANGGNADTIANHGIKEVINRDDDDLVVGVFGSNYSSDTCDIYTTTGEIDSDLFASELSNINGGTVLFKKGSYSIADVYAQFNKKEPIIFRGVNYKLSTLAVNDLVMNNTTFKDIKIKDSKSVVIESEVDLENVIFENCNIMINKSNCCNIKNCIFNNCSITIQGPITNNIIKCNRYIYTAPIKYLGGNNIITENL